MTRKKKTVFLTGATGIMGSAGLAELLKRRDRFDIRLLVRPSERNHKKLEGIEKESGVTIVWGDLTDYHDVLRGITGADYVLHVGGMVSPKADRLPLTTRRVNISAAENITKAVLAQPNADNIKVVYIGSVAQTSDRNAPIHWGRTGDPICISVYDHYAISKTVAERIFVESGIKNWVCLRQSGILYPGILRNYDPIMFHVPLNGVLEWATVEDSGRLLANVCDDSVPTEFWNRFYNIGSGEPYRITNYEFIKLMLRAVSCPAPEKIFEANWFVLRNFHGQWYLDSDVLDNYLHFRENLPIDQYFERLRGQVPYYFSLAKIAPPFVIKLAMRAMAYKKEQGAMDWIRTRNPLRIASFYGTVENWEAIPEWKNFDLTRPSAEAVHIDHGYDESKPTSELDLADMQQAAEFRGGKCLSNEMVKGNMAGKLQWECQFGHRFEASPALVLLGGHWCPECLPPPWNYDRIAAGNQFFAQVWHPLHGTDENNFYDETIFDDWER
jgi:nucleoside-diphosphate-sugar epimerase